MKFKATSAKRNNQNIAKLTLMLIQLACASAIMPKAFAQEPIATNRKYEIPAGPLDSALNQFARNSGVMLSFPPATTKGKETKGLKGNYSTQEGFKELLKGTGLEIINDQHGGYFLDKAGPASANQNKSEIEIDLKTVKVRAKKFKDIGPLPGLALTKEQIAGNIQSISAKEIKESHSLSLSDLLNSKLQSVNVNDYQGNPFQMDVTYRGFTASPQIGTPQGLSVFFDGVRVNEPFGDVVNWDMIPMNAISGLDVFPGSNPLFGLNTLGGSFVMKTKSGFTDPGVSAEILAGSYGRKQLQASGGWNNANKEEGSWDGGDYAAFAAVNLFLEDGWRQNSPSKVNQAYGKLEWQGERASLSFSALGATNKLVGNGTVPQELYNQDATAVFTSPDETKNNLLQFKIAGAFDVNDHFNITGQAYHRKSNRFSNTGDIIDQETFSNLDKDYAYNQTRLPGQGNGLQCAYVDSDGNGMPDFYMLRDSDMPEYYNKLSAGFRDFNLLQLNPTMPDDVVQAYKNAFAKGVWHFSVFSDTDDDITEHLPVGAVPYQFMSGTGVPYFDGVEGYTLFAKEPVNADTCRSFSNNEAGMISNKTRVIDASHPQTEDDIPLQRDGAHVNAGRFGSGVVEGTPTAVITKSDIQQTINGTAIQLNWNYDSHKFMVGAALDQSKASYIGKQRLALLDNQRNVFSDPSQLGEEFWAGSHDVTINDFDGTSLTKSLYFSETWSPSQTLNFSLSGRYNDTHVVNSLAPKQAERRLEDLRWINQYVYGIICQGSTANCPFSLDSPLPADFYWNQLISLENKDPNKMLDKTATEKFSFYSFNPALGATWQVKPNLNLYANWNQGTRAPSVIELGCAYDDTLVGVGDFAVPRSIAEGRGCSLPSALSGDPYLPQVKARTMEVGARGKFNDFMEWNISAYRTNVIDDIYMTSLTSELSFFQSIGNTRRQGIEFGLAGEYGKSDFRVNYSLTEATFESYFKTASPNNSSRGLIIGMPDYNMIQVRPGNVMPGVPFNNFNFNWGYKLTPKLKMNWNLVAHSGSYLRGNENNAHTPSPSREVTLYSDINIKTPANEYSGTAPGYAVLNFNTHYDIGKGWGVTVAVNNVLDKKYYTAGRLGLNPFAPSTLGAIGPGGFNYNSSEWISSQFISAGAPRGVWFSVGYDFDASKKSVPPKSTTFTEADRTLERGSELPSTEELALIRQLDNIKALPVLTQLKTGKLEIKEVVESWRKAILANDVNSYVQWYASTYAPERVSHNQWVDQQKLLFTSEVVSEAKVNNLVITPRDKQIVAIFTYALTRGEKYGEERKVLTFEQKDGKWRIVRERSLPTSHIMASAKSQLKNVNLYPNDNISELDFPADMGVGKQIKMIKRFNTKDTSKSTLNKKVAQTEVK